MKALEKVLERTVVPRYEEIEGVKIYKDPRDKGDELRRYIIFYFVNEPNFKYNPTSSNIIRTTQTLFDGMGYGDDVRILVDFKYVDSE